MKTNKISNKKRRYKTRYNSDTIFSRNVSPPILYQPPPP
nr:MAG TPA: hypothetical protein [Caudoviricetes sp.]